MDILGFVAHLGFMAAGAEHGNKEALEHAASVMEAEAKSAIGTYKYGWPPLSPATLAKKAADTPLLETGELRDSYEHAVIDGNNAEMGTNNPKGVWHELGTPTIPPRPVVGGAVQAKEAEVIAILEGGALKMIGVSK